MKITFVLFVLFLTNFVSCSNVPVNEKEDEGKNIIGENAFQLIIECKKTEIKVGEPLEFKCRFINKTNKRIDIKIGYDIETNVIYSCTQIIEPEIDYTRKEGELPYVGDINFPSGGLPNPSCIITVLHTTEGCCFVDIGKKFPRPGSYKIKFKYSFYLSGVFSQPPPYLWKKDLVSNEIFVNVTN